MEADAIHDQLGPIGGQAGIELEAIGTRGEAEEAIQHDLWHHGALEEFHVEPEPACRAAALKSAFARAVVILAVAAGGLDFVEPGEDFAQALPGVVRAEDFETSHQVVVREAEDGAAILDLAAPGNAFRVVPGPEIPVEVALGGRARAEAPVVDVLALGGVALDSAVTVDPAQDGLGVLGRGEVVIDGFEVKESEAVVVGLAVGIDAGIEAPVFRDSRKGGCLRLSLRRRDVRAWPDRGSGLRAGFATRGGR